MTATAANIVPFRSQPERITRENLVGRNTTNAIHYDTRTEAVWSYGVEGISRLGVLDVYVRKTRQSRRTWSVDGKPVRDLDAALAVLNGEKTLEEAVQEAEQVVPPEASRPGKVSIDAQIAEIDYELAQRASVYPRIAASNPQKARENELHVQRMQAVRVTLVWLRDNEAKIRQRMSY